ncbi:MAG: transcriptional regulator [Candidatus Nanosalina sp. J07AB43]|jgi:Transcriptional regulators|nr:MAG: transcriptional regulator [Candidatus Nanosalina sp. J07AB43]
MDSKDREILDRLEEDGRAAFTEISEDMNVSEGTVRNRVQRMKDQGIIEKFTVEVSEREQVKAFVSVDISTEREFEAVLDDLPDDVEVFEVAGRFDLFVKVSRYSSEEVNKVVDDIRSIGGVNDTTTYMVLSDSQS